MPPAFVRSTSQLNTVTLTNQLDPALLQPDGDLFTLGPGDQLQIEMTGNVSSRTQVQVGPDGKIYFNVLPGLDVWGLTLAQTKALLEKHLSKYFNAPQVELSLRSVGSKYVWLLGRLNRPGVYPISGPMTLLESLALAGGTARSASQVSSEELADLRHSFIVRQGRFLPVDFYRLLHDGDTSENIYLEPNDFVYVPSALNQEVYILGAVRSPRAMAYVDGMTLVTAISGSTGPVQIHLFDNTRPGPMAKNAYLSHVAIVRGSLTEPQIAVVDLGAIVRGKAPDVRLEPGDIIYVPNSPYTTLTRYLNLIVNTFVTTVAANEGTRAGGGGVSVGVSVPVGSQ